MQSIFERSIAGAFAAFICFIGIFTLIKTSPPGSSLASISSGAWQAKYEQGFERQNIIRTYATEAYNALQYLLVGQVQLGVVIGRDRWLFSETEFKIEADFETALADNTNAVAAMIKTLNSHGIKSHVVIVPDKARVMQNFSPQPRAVAVQMRYQKLTTGLRDLDVSVIAPYDELHIAAAQEQVFLRTDTHWSAQGAILVAQTALDQIGALNVGSASTQLVHSGTQLHDGDLYNFLDLGAFRTALGFELETIDIYALKTKGETSAADLFGDTKTQAADIHLIGTSYSQDVKWSFADALQAFSGLNVINYAQQGYGPIKPMQDYLDKVVAKKLTLPEFVIWEIPEKYMSLPPEKMAEREETANAL